MADNKQSRGFTNHKREEDGPSEIYIGPKRPSLTIDVDVDVSEALTGLKALQREAKEATKALRELEKAQEVPEHIKQYREHYSWESTGGNCKAYFSDVPTTILAEELSHREGVETYHIGPHGAFAKLTLDNVTEGKTVFIEGPAIITVNKD